MEIFGTSVAIKLCSLRLRLSLTLDEVDDFPSMPAPSAIPAPERRQAER